MIIDVCKCFNDARLPTRQPVLRNDLAPLRICDKLPVTRSPIYEFGRTWSRRTTKVSGLLSTKLPATCRKCVTSFKRPFWLDGLKKSIFLKHFSKVHILKNVLLFF